MSYRGFQDLPRRASSDKELHDRAFNIAKNLEYDGYQHGLASTIYKLSNEKCASANTSGGAIKNQTMWNQQLALEINKWIVRKLEKRKVYASFKEIWGADLADMELIRKYNKGICFFFIVLFVVFIVLYYSFYYWYF